MTANKNRIRFLSNNSRSSKEIKQCIQNSEGEEKPNYILSQHLSITCESGIKTFSEN